jgi:uncharacterized membrane protein
MNESIKRFPALLAYLLPVVGWIYILIFERKSVFVMFHLKQALGLFGFLLSVATGWVILAWLIAMIPYGFILSVSLFTLVIAALIFGVVAWISGVINVLRGKVTFLPLVGRKAYRLSLE